MKPTRRTRLFGIEQLEGRLCLSVTAQVTAGALIVEGLADGPVEIKAVEQGKFEVTDNGALIATVEGVTKDVRIKLDAGGGTTDDQVTLDLAGTAVTRVTADLGGGNNQFVVKGGTVNGGLTYRGGSGDDSVRIDADAVVKGQAVLQLRGGDNSLDVQGNLGRNLAVLATSGDDVLQIGPDARIVGVMRPYLFSASR